MAALFTAASTQRLTNSVSPLTAMPFTIGMLVRPTDTTSRYLWSITDTAVLDHFWAVRKSATWDIQSAAGATTTTAGGGTVTANQWHFVLCRIISATNRLMAVLEFDGTVIHVSSTASRAPAGIDMFAIGSLETSAPGSGTMMNGHIGEFWYTNTDIQVDGLQLKNQTLLQLAYGGPFSIPHIAQGIIEYRSFRKYPSSEADEIGEVFNGAAGRQTWANINGVTIGHHPQLPYWYAKPPGAQWQSPWQKLLGIQNWGEAPPWPPPGDFLQPDLYVNQGTQRW